MFWIGPRTRPKSTSARQAQLWWARLLLGDANKALSPRARQNTDMWSLEHIRSPWIRGTAHPG
ncbi:hypothetical protein A2U01_0063355 [Trifolium medium]|uniref:Uncharacterized protein n=1 Tax=Trifolium medium TaxID=97028 RepID=A0A392S275_9FABA|nr:hypothetical protein [Trifolium medium]